MFLHFGLRSFYERIGNEDTPNMDPARFMPEPLDCNQWAETAKAAGMRYMVLTTKHHDGFCLWPTKTTDFSVASSGWREGKGDVVRDYVEACRAHGLGVGLYYSPADWKCACYDDAQAYNDYFFSQMEELMRNYGTIDLVWFDLAYSKHPYDWPRIINMMRKHSPNILMNSGDPNVRHGGSEAGIAPWPLWNTVTEWTDPSTSTKRSDPDNPRWVPVEVCAQMRQFCWFYQDFDEHTVKLADELMCMYYHSVGRGSNLLLNLGPDRRGLLPEPDRSNLLEFGAILKDRFSSPIVSCPGAPLSTGKQVIEHDLAEEPIVDHVVLEENLAQGEHVQKYRLQVLPAGHTIAPVTVAEGYGIGHKAIVPLHAMRIKQVRLELTCEGDGALKTLDLHGRPSPWA